MALYLRTLVTAFNGSNLRLREFEPFIFRCQRLCDVLELAREH
jgi:hypothetical protein